MGDSKPQTGVTMASWIEGLILGPSPEMTTAPPSDLIVPLACGLALLPLTSQIQVQLGRHEPASRVEGLSALTDAVVRRARVMSADRQVLYVFGETFGGTGDYEAIGWHRRAIFFGPLITSDAGSPEGSAINLGLRAMGIRAAHPLDEFATVGLDRHRRTEDWYTA
jgi:hypothetical protein